MGKQKKLSAGGELPELPVTFKPLIEAIELPAGSGADLVKEALAGYQGERRAQVLAQVRVLIDRAALVERIIRKSLKQRELCKAQLAAIDAGEFIVSEQTLRIIFNNEILNISWDDTATW